MKFNFEKAKNVVKKSAVFGGIAAKSLTFSGDTANFNNEQKDDLDTKNKTGLVNQGIGDSSELGYRTINFEDASNSLKNKIENNKDIELIKKIDNMENILSKYSKEKGEIFKGSIALISSSDFKDTESDIENKIINGVEVTSPLDNRYIKDLILNELVNNNLKVLDRDPKVGSVPIKEEFSLEKEGYVESEGYKHTIPEYYFILDQEKGDSSQIILKFKIFSSEKRSVVAEKSFKYDIPSDENQLPDFVENTLVPDVSKNIKDFLN